MKNLLPSVYALIGRPGSSSDPAAAVEIDRVAISSLLLHTCCLNHHHSFEECLGHELNANLGQEARGGYLW